MCKDCQYCGVPLTDESPHGSKKFCSSKCKTTHNNAKRKARLITKRNSQTCESCGKIFAADKLRKYCSTKCQIKVSRARVVARNQARLRSATCERCGKTFQAKRGGKGNRFGRWCPECRPVVDLTRRRRWKKRKAIDRGKYGRCRLCGEPAAWGKTKCQKHLDQYNQYSKNRYKRLKEEKLLKEQEDRFLHFPLGIFEFVPKEKSEELFKPTKSQPGSEEKILILQERVSKGLPLFHPDDRTNKMPLFNFDNWVTDDHPEPTISHMSPQREDDYGYV